MKLESIQLPMILILWIFKLSRSELQRGNNKHKKILLFINLSSQVFSFKLCPYGIIFVIVRTPYTWIT